MDQPMSNFHFWGMSVVFKVRDLFVPPKRKLAEVGLAPGATVLDFGCGPGSLAVAAAGLVGSTGKVYAVDIHPRAVEAVQRRAARHGLTDLEAIRAAAPNGLPSESVDVVLLYDTFHALSDPEAVLDDLHRVLKPDGLLSFSDHHMKESDIVAKVAGPGLFELAKKGKMTFTFKKARKPRQPLSTAARRRRRIER